MPAAGEIDSMAFMLVLAALGLTLAVAVRARPQWGLLAFVVMLCFVPPWLGVTLKVFLTPLTLVAIVMVVALWRGERIPLRVYDGVMALVLGLIAVCFIVGYVDLVQTYGAIIGWGIPYLAGRVAGARIDARFVATCIALFFGVVSVLAIVEFVTANNLFSQLHSSNPAYARWSGIRIRGGVPRVEGAFGNSIALGGALAMSVPFAWTSRLHAGLKALILVLIGTASVLTFSRIGMGCTAFAVVLCMTVLRGEVSKSFRAWTAVAAVIGVGIAISFASGIFSSAGQEAEGSAEYRSDLTSLIPAMSWIGQSASTSRDSAGTTSYGDFESIDSAMILVGLNYGILPLVVLLVSAVVSIVALLRGYRSASLVSVVALIPGLTSVAFITQFTTFFWFVVGMAVAQTARTGPSAEVRAEEPPARHAELSGVGAFRSDSIDGLPRVERSSGVTGRLPDRRA
ncbi:hypothetical protein [Cellulomonas sp. URHE0023]|uniref:hypothetical protein n=1 Tax=Cellulomonas sp. URHE0023 TaxID=1380354 RepID=UPI0004827BF9|nr:hypothetical protein [Cellulomonas sp. URHE0023]